MGNGKSGLALVQNTIKTPPAGAVPSGKPVISSGGKGSYSPANVGNLFNTVAASDMEEPSTGSCGGACGCNPCSGGSEESMKKQSVNGYSDSTGRVFQVGYLPTYFDSKVPSDIGKTPPNGAEPADQTKPPDDGSSPNGPGESAGDGVLAKLAGIPLWAKLLAGAVAVVAVVAVVKD